MLNKKCGFTLVELLTAVVIMVILVSFGLPTIVNQYSKAKKQKAIAQIIRLENAINNFKNDMGYYPNSLIEGEYLGDNSLDQIKRSMIIEAVSGYNKNKSKISAYWDDPDWHGPYLEFKKSELDSAGQMIDPWKQPYIFDATVGGRSLQNTGSFDILSKGPDKEWDSANEFSSKNDDNICNWLPDYYEN